MMGPALEKLALDPEFMDYAFDPDEAELFPPTPHGRMALLAGEAEKALEMIEPHLAPGLRLLEIGGGAGLVHARLRARGFDVISLEPGGAGFGDRHRAGLRLLHHLEIDPRGWLQTGIEDFTGVPPFDVIFSYFVLEHLADLDRSFRAMAALLAPGGLMVHCCPNYVVPYEPHYNLLLVPGRPRLTALFRPGLSRAGLWRGLNFITARQVAGLCARHGLTPNFRPGMGARACERLLADPLFAARKRGMAWPVAQLRKTGLLALLRHLPPALATPMEFSAVRADGDC